MSFCSILFDCNFVCLKMVTVYTEYGISSIKSYYTPCIESFMALLMSHVSRKFVIIKTAMCGSRREGNRGSGLPPPLKRHKNKGFLSNTGLDPLKNHKAAISQHSMLGHHQPASETPFKWRFAGGPMMARY